MTTKNIFFTPCFRVELPQILGLGFPVYTIDFGVNEMGLVHAPLQCDVAERARAAEEEPKA